MSEPLEAATDALLQRLLDAWAECIPSQLSTNPELASAACCQAILVCARRLLNRQPPGRALAPVLRLSQACDLCKMQDLLHMVSLLLPVIFKILNARLRLSSRLASSEALHPILPPRTISEWHLN